MHASNASRHATPAFMAIMRTGALAGGGGGRRGVGFQA